MTISTETFTCTSKYYYHSTILEQYWTLGKVGHTEALRYFGVV